MRAFESINNVLEVGEGLREVYPNVGKGLSEICGTMLGKPLDKAEQCSDWEQRPLRAAQVFDVLLPHGASPTTCVRIRARDSRPVRVTCCPQIEYAALDAVCLVWLSHALAKIAPSWEWVMERVRHSKEGAHAHHHNSHQEGGRSGKPSTVIDAYPEGMEAWTSEDVRSWLHAHMAQDGDGNASESWTHPILERSPSPRATIEQWRGRTPPALCMVEANAMAIVCHGEPCVAVIPAASRLCLKVSSAGMSLVVASRWCSPSSPNACSWLVHLDYRHGSENCLTLGHCKAPSQAGKCRRVPSCLWVPCFLHAALCLSATTAVDDDDHHHNHALLLRH